MIGGMTGWQADLLVSLVVVTERHEIGPFLHGGPFTTGQEPATEHRPMPERRGLDKLVTYGLHIM